MKLVHSYRRRQGSIMITLIGALLFVVVFFASYCFKQLQANHQGAKVPAARKPFTAMKNHHWPSPDSRLAFRLPPDFSLRRRTFKLANQENGRVLWESEGEIVRCKWRGENQACAVEYKRNAGGNDVVLLLINGDRVTPCRPSNVIRPNQFLPAGDQTIASQWDHTVKLGEFRDDGDLLVQWFGTAKLVRPGKRDRATTVECDFRIRYTDAGDLRLVESFPQGKPKTKTHPGTTATADNVVIPRGIRLRPFRPKNAPQVSTSSEGSSVPPRSADSD